MTSATATERDADDVCIATLRTLCIDAIEAARSGHPGTPVGIAPVTYTLWQRFLRFDPADPIWPNRDRFVLSAGHALLATAPRSRSRWMPGTNLPATAFGPAW